jgi:hypothetical protein
MPKVERVERNALVNTVEHPREVKIRGQLQRSESVATDAES